MISSPLIRRLLTLGVFVLLTLNFTQAQVENVPANHPVYDFLKRMHVKRFFTRYFDAIIPMSRSAVVSYLDSIETKRDLIGTAESGYLDEYNQEFAFDRDGTLGNIISLLPATGVNEEVDRYDLFGNKEKFLYILKDNNISLFANALGALNVRRFFSDPGDERAEYFQGGVRVRGTLYEKLGFLAQATNAQFWGSRALLQQDPVIGQSYALGTVDSKNFDFSEGYARYDAGMVAVQAGRERILWGYGRGQQMVLSDNIRVFDFLKADFQYKSFKYTFLHAWILGRRQILDYTLPSDTSSVFQETVAADKYFAAHRIEFSFGHMLDLGFQEMAIYSNRSLDLAYLNPFIIIESAQRSREERDNVFWMFDLRTRAIQNIELHGSLLLDDIHFSEAFSNSWINRFGFQLGGMYVDPFGLNNVSMTAEYTRIEPFVFSHGRSRENDYGSLGRVLGPSIGPNADKWLFRVDYFPYRHLVLSIWGEFTRKGNNILDANGVLIKNVGGDILLPHRNTDPETKSFLDGILVRTKRFSLQANLEIWNQIWWDLRYQNEAIKVEGVRSTTHLVISGIRAEF